MLARLITPEVDEIEFLLDLASLGLLGDEPEPEEPDLGPVRSVATRWLSWWEARAPVVAGLRPGHPPTWDQRRLEYAFHLRASTLNSALLTARGYTGGRLDWWAVDAHRTGAPSFEDHPRRDTLRTVPAPVRFGGMPVPRFWEMEDATFDPGAVEAAASDLGRLLLVAFASVYSNDWFVLPLRLPVASLTRVTRFVVSDVFGGQTLVGQAGAADDGWNLFGLTDATQPRQPGGERATSPWFFLPPALPDSLESQPIESVLLLRDEMANLAWAVESLVTDDAGRPVDRAGRWAARPPPPAEPGVFYRAATEVPDHWYPLAPEKLPDLESIVLRLLPLAVDADGAGRSRPIGAFLARARTNDPEAVWLHEEEVPRAGAQVVRTRQHARGHDGSVHVWTGRRKLSGRGEGASGLRFDTVDDQDAG